ncbi:ThuA domain-containing protein [Haloferula sp. A504]|uniref:ThuA domain-containing protein n=1 Tax=Haloferula sp. A504 TaxID=3373601 RepID=UPI0031C24AD0|nr:ThuA domain-containing protein [Verrucomicrobiaceae bacterium E54]
MRSERIIAAWFALLLVGGVSAPVADAQKIPAFELDEAWKEKVAAVAPEKPQVAPKQARKVLIFSLATGFKHWCIPHTEAVIEILGKRSGAYESVASVDIEVFRPERLRAFDAVVLNNNCPTGKKRDLFYDVLVQKIGDAGKKYEAMPADEREELARMLYRSLVDYVEKGGGLVLMHGAIANFAYSEEFSELAGGSFSYHPPQQEVTLHPCCPDHPMLKPFGGKPFVHVDEPYVMGGAYEKFNFAPMLELDTEGIKVGKDRGFHDQPRYVSWIKPHKQGRVFFSSPSHNAQSFERPELLRYLLNGMQYATGDLECDDSPLKR